MVNGNIEVLISEMNAKALAENLADLRLAYDRRLSALERQVATLTSLVQRQNTVIGQYLQASMGSGSTEPEDS